MKAAYGLIAMTALLLSGNQSYAQSALFDFETGDDQGWGDKFADGSKVYPVDNIGGSNRMRVLRDGGFQEAEYNSGNPVDPFFLAMSAAALNESLYQISYDYYIDTANWGANAGTFLHLGTYVNAGSGDYFQDFPGAGKDVELNSTQLASGGVFSGTIAETFSAKGYDLRPNGSNPGPETFFRLGLILNGDGSSQTVHFDNIRIAPIPEPASLGLVALAGLGLLAVRRRSR